MTLGATRDDLLRVLGALFQRTGGEAADVVDLRNALTFDLAWFTPTEAKIVLRAAEREGLLKPDGERLRPGFDPHGIVLPAGYRPPKAVVEWARRSAEAKGGEPVHGPSHAAAPTAAASAPPAKESHAPAVAAPGNPSAPLLDRFVERIAAAAGESEALVRDRVLVQRRALGDAVNAEVAAMLVGLGLGVDLSDLVQELEARLRAA